MNAVALSYAQTELRALIRSPVSIMFFFGIPALISAILGPAVSGLSGPAASGRTAVGFAAMFAYMSVNYMGRALYREHYFYTWRRNAIVAPPKISYLGGKGAAVFAISATQLASFVAVAALFLDLPLNGLNGTFQITVTFALHAATGVAIGAAMFTTVSRAETFFSLTYLIMVTFGALGGSIVASEQLPAWSAFVGRATPHYWTMRALDNVTTGDAQWSVTLESVFVLASFVLAFSTYAWYKFDYTSPRYADE